MVPPCTPAPKQTMTKPHQVSLLNMSPTCSLLSISTATILIHPDCGLSSIAVSRWSQRHSGLSPFSPATKMLLKCRSGLVTLLVKVLPWLTIALNIQSHPYKFGYRALTVRAWPSTLCTVLWPFGSECVRLLVPLGPSHFHPTQPPSGADPH